MRKIRNIRTGDVYTSDDSSASTALRRTLMMYGSYDNFFWPGDEVPDDMLLALFRRNYIVGLGIVHPQDAVDVLRRQLGKDQNGNWVFPEPEGITATAFKNVDQAEAELYPDWAERINNDLGAVPYKKFVVAQDKLPDDGEAGPEELYQMLKYLLAEEDLENYPETGQDDLEDAEEVWYAHRWMASKWRDAMGPMAQYRYADVTETPYGLALLMRSSDGKRLLRVPFEDIVKRSQKDLGRIMLWLDFPTGYDNAVDYEEGDTHVLLWPEPEECDGARHVPNDLLPWGARA